jgi:alpha-N-arabinofuranosidase
LTRPLPVAPNDGAHRLHRQDGGWIMPRSARLTPVLLLLMTVHASAQAPVRIVISADLGTTTISRHIYGQFAEDLGRLIYDGFWTRTDSGPWHLRDDVIEALRRIRIPNLRWPGGCFSEYYHWRDGIGPARDRRPMSVVIRGGVVEDNSFGTHEYLELVQRLGADAFIVGNVGGGTVEEMTEWWQYLTAPAGPLAEDRARNGHAAPFAVPFWGVGNENWGCGGDMSAQTYAAVYRRYAEFLRTSGNTRAFRIAAGGNGTGEEAEALDWMETMMREAGPAMDGLDLHYYTVVGPWAHKGSATDFGEHEWFTAMQRAERMDTLIVRSSTIMDRYDPQKRVWLIIGEWGMWHDPEPGTNPRFYQQQNTMRDAVVAGLHLNIFNSHADRVRMANLAQTVNVLQSLILTHGDTMIVTPTYWVFDLYKVHQDATLLPLDIKSDAYTFDGQSVPAVSASASKDKDGRIHISLVNLDPNRARTAQVDIRGQQVSSVTGRVLTAPAMQAHNTFEQPKAVQPVDVRGARLSGGILTLDLPSKSVVVVELR